MTRSKSERRGFGAFLERVFHIQFSLSKGMLLGLSVIPLSQFGKLCQPGIYLVGFMDSRFLPNRKVLTVVKWRRMDEMFSSTTKTSLCDDFDTPSYNLMTISLHHNDMKLKQFPSSITVLPIVLERKK